MLLSDMFYQDLVPGKGSGTVPAYNGGLVFLVHLVGLAFLDIQSNGMISLGMAMQSLDLNSIPFDSLQS